MYASDDDLLGGKLYDFGAPKTIRLLIIEFNLNLKSLKLAQTIKKEKCFQLLISRLVEIQITHLYQLQFHYYELMKFLK